MKRHPCVCVSMCLCVCLSARVCGCLEGGSTFYRPRCTSPPLPSYSYSYSSFHC